MRQFYCEVWRKYCNKQTLEPLEHQLAEIIQQHPEYQPLLENTEAACSKDYLPESGESNPFLHMGLHMAIQEQLATNKPAGIRNLYQQLLSDYPDPHQLEHGIMECLAEMLWQAQRNNTAPNEEAYLQCIKTLLKHTPQS
jgi:hypothetical protein